MSSWGRMKVRHRQAEAKISACFAASEVSPRPIQSAPLTSCSSGIASWLVSQVYANLKKPPAWRPVPTGRLGLPCRPNSQFCRQISGCVGPLSALREHAPFARSVKHAACMCRDALKPKPCTESSSLQAARTAFALPCFAFHALGIFTLAPQRCCCRSSQQPNGRRCAPKTPI